jgi:hypothetical protein
MAECPCWQALTMARADRSHGGEQPLDRGAADREHPLLLLRISSQVAVAFQGLQP